MSLRLMCLLVLAQTSQKHAFRPSESLSEFRISSYGSCRTKSCPTWDAALTLSPVLLKLWRILCEHVPPYCPRMMNLTLKPIQYYWASLSMPFAEWPNCYPRDTSPKCAPPRAAANLLPRPIFEAWLESRTLPNNDAKDRLSPGAQRAVTRQNLSLASEISKKCALNFCAMIWNLHPYRLTILILFDIFRGIFPAFRGYSQAMILDEVQHLFSSSGDFDLSRLLRLLVLEVIRTALESALDLFSSNNEQVLNNSIRFVMEQRQMEQRLRMDIPTMESAVIRELFQEADLFVRSFNGVANFGLLSPFDLIRTLGSVSELFSHIFVLYSLTRNETPGVLSLLSVASLLYPLFLPWLTPSKSYYNDHQNPLESRSAAKQEHFRSLAQNDAYRPEVILFGLGPWIMRNWSSARKVTLGLEHVNPTSQGGTGSLFSLLTPMDITGLITALHNVPLVLALQASSASLGSFTLYRNSLQSIVYSSRNCYNTVNLAFQSVFLLGAFTASMQVKPKMQPRPDKLQRYIPSPRGMRIEVRDIYFTYPGSTEPALRNISFSLEPGETLAIVGFNGSGKSTLANVLLRILEFESGQIVVNGCDVSKLDPTEYHRHVSTVFQGFAKFHATARTNIGVGSIDELKRTCAIETAADLADASHVINSLPRGLKTILEPPQGSNLSFGVPTCGGPTHERHGLSGGEWQRIAISRSFMRACRPEVELLVFDEPTSSLDAHAQNRVFNTISELSKTASGEPLKTVIFITHRLSTARRADKIAMMDHGSIIEFGSHQELLARNGAYASLYRASV